MAMGREKEISYFLHLYNISTRINPIVDISVVFCYNSRYCHSLEWFRLTKGSDVFLDDERLALRELLQTVVAEVLGVLGLILFSRIWNSVAGKTRTPDRYTLSHQDFEPVRMFMRGVVRKQFQYRRSEDS